MLYDKRWDQKLDAVEREREAARQALLRAADYIEAHGWCQCFWSLSGKVCAVTALNEVGAWSYTPVGNTARRLFYDRYGDSLMFWNDAAGRTEEEVLTALRSF